MVALRHVLGILILHLTWVTSTFANKKFVGGVDCIISQYCQDSNAIEALHTALGIPRENATQHVTNRTRARSCSCHDSCVYLGVCCQDKELTVPTPLQPLAKRLKEIPNSYSCQVTLGMNTVVIDTCPSDSPVVMSAKCAQDKCLPHSGIGSVSFEELEGSLLVTSNISMLTYKNLYCGLCNGEKYGELKAWSFNFDCYVQQFQGITPAPPISGSSIAEQALQSGGCSLSRTVPIIPPAGLEVHPYIGVYMDNASLCSAPPISSCPSGSDKAEDCTNYPISLISYKSQVYRNEHCLRCNQKSQAIRSAICESCDNEDCEHPYSQMHRIPPLVGSFGILVQPYDDTTVVQCKIRNNQRCGNILSNLVTCGYGQYRDYQTSTCVNVCPETFRLIDGLCQFVSETCQVNFERNDFEKVSVSMYERRQLHGSQFMVLGKNVTPCYDCTKVKAITNHTEGFEVTNKGEVKVKSYPVPPNFIYNVNNVTFYVCLDAVIAGNETETGARNYKAEEVITFFLLSLSILSLLLYFVAYLMFKRLRNVPGKLVAGNMMCLFFAYTFFCIRHVPGLEGSTGCTIVAILINYFFLASFTFNILYAAFIIHSLDSVGFESSVTNLTAVWMWAIGLLVPLTVIIPGIVMDNMPNQKYQPQYGEGACFIPSQQAQIIYFIAPIGLCLLVAILLYATIIAKLIQLARETSMVRSNHSEKIAIAIKLVTVLGFNWIFAVIAAAEQGPISSLIFIVTCCLQGFFGFIVFICNKTTLTDIKKCLNQRTNLSFEMSNSSRAASRKHTLNTDVTKDLLKQKDSSKVLLNSTEGV